jgi:4-amino-4-deoxy-L-arabinose transferase-like glycosyltransferase
MGLALLAVLLLALTLRLLRVGVREAWLDEACTALFAQSDDLGALLDVLRPESHPPLYYLLLYGWVRLVGAGEVALRLPSVLAGLALVPLVAEAVRRHGGGLLAAGLAALVAAGSPLLVHYSVEAKAYTLLWALALGLVLLLHRATDAQGDPRRAFAGAAVVTIAALYTHHYALFLLPLWPVAILAARRRARAYGALLLVAVALVYAPWGLGFLGGQAAAGGTSWLAAFQTGPLAALAGSARLMALAPPFPRYLGELGLLELPAGAALATGLWFGGPVLLGLLAAFAAPGAALGADSAARWRVWLRRSLLPLAVALPTVAAAAVSAGRPLYLVGRYELMAYPAWIALWALGVDWLVRRPARPALLGGLRVTAVAATVAGLASVALPYVARPPEPWPHRDAARALVAAPADDAVVVVGLARAPLEHQLRNLGDVHALVSFPPELAQHPGWFEPRRHDPAALADAARALAGELGRRPAVWLVTPLGPDGGLRDPAIALTMFAALREAGRTPGPPQVFGGLGVARFE